MLIVPCDIVRLKKRNTRKKVTVKRRSRRSTILVNQSIKNSLIQKMTLLKGEKERLMTEILTSITRLSQIQSMNQVKEKRKERRIAMKTKNTEKGHPVTTKGKEMSKTMMKMLMTEIMTSPSQKDMLQVVGPILMPVKGGMEAFPKQIPIDLLLLHLNMGHTIIVEMWLLSFRKTSGLLNLDRCN